MEGRTCEGDDGGWDGGLERRGCKGGSVGRGEGGEGGVVEFDDGLGEGTVLPTIRIMAWNGQSPLWLIKRGSLDHDRFAPKRNNRITYAFQLTSTCSYYKQDL